ncbi:hypothetical protein [Rheinheimera sp. EpRS3]|uniref:hypothetical protein n=1 Tax=Rheinheimera sp. EpRS3 TaxID=1712383 RepID=UPI000747B6E0|nr:hypothetical protein [Rheinheimera sp. EpRS3]KUM53771.1 hypothetical protein AR688_19125 [Rheinheimera sp. EpRS3]
MIKFYELTPITVFDGDVAQQKAPMTFSVKGQPVRLAISDLISLNKLAHIGCNLPFNADDLSLALSLPVTNLGAVKIHKGSKQGLKLYFSIIDDLLYVFSFGEYQPGRFLCIFECAVHL